MLRRWFKMGGKIPRIDHHSHFSFLLIFLKKLMLSLSHGVLIFLLSTWFLITFLSLKCRNYTTSSSAEYTSLLSLSLPECYASPPLALLPVSQEFLFTGLWEFLFLFASCFYMFSHSSWLILLPTLMPLAIISTPPVPTLVWATDPFVHFSTRQLYFVSLGYVKFNAAKSELVLP